MARGFADKRLIEIAVRIFVFLKRSFGKCIEDVCVWFDTHNPLPQFGIRGNPWLLYKGMLSRFPLYQRDHSMELTISGVLGIDQKPVYSGKRMVGVSPQFSSGDSLEICEFFEMFERMLSDVLAEMGYQTDSYTTRLTIIPFPGVPMTMNAKTLPFFSIRSKRVEHPPTPRWVVPIADSKDSYGQPSSAPSVNLCMISRTARNLYEEPYAFAVRPPQGRSPATFVMVAHSSDEDLFSDQASAGIESCGGLLYPSLSVGSIPASNFGPISLVFDPRLVLKDLSPFRKGDGARSTPPDTILYRTDSWTPTQAEFVGSYAARAYVELSGNENYANYYRPAKALYSLGPFGMASDPEGEVIEITSSQEMCSVVNQRMKIWRDQSYEQFLKTRHNVETKHHYGYLEAKLISVLPLSWVSVVVAPSDVADRIGSYLSHFGFKGRVIPMALSHEEYEVFYGKRSTGDIHFADWVRLRYAWKVSEAVRATGEGVTF